MGGHRGHVNGALAIEQELEHLDLLRREYGEGSRRPRDRMRETSGLLQIGVQPSWKREATPKRAKTGSIQFR